MRRVARATKQAERMSREELGGRGDRRPLNYSCMSHYDKLTFASSIQTYRLYLNRPTPPLLKTILFLPGNYEKYTRKYTSRLSKRETIQSTLDSATERRGRRAATSRTMCSAQLTLAGTEAFARHPDCCAVDAVVVIQATQG